MNRLLISFLLLLVVFVSPCFSTEDPANFPSKPVTMVVPWSPGGSGDMTTRKLCELATEKLGQQITVINKPGGSGVTGTILVKQAKPDGYTIGMATWSPFTIVPHIRELPYKTKEDFTWIAQFAEVAHVFAVQSTSPWKSFKQFIEDARKNPGKLKYSTPGPISGSTIVMEMIFHQENVKVIFVPVGGGREGDTQLLGGHIDGMVSPSLYPYIKDGRVRGLMQAQLKERFELFPEIPTHYELGYNIDTPDWYGILGPKGIHPEIAEKLGDAFKSACESSTYKDFMGSIYHRAVYRGPESFRALVFKDYDTQAKDIKELIDRGVIKRQ